MGFMLGRLQWQLVFDADLCRLQLPYCASLAICKYLLMVKITYSKDALRFLQRMPANEARRVLEKVAGYAADPASQAANVRALKGRPGYRLRVGDWRVILEREADGIFVLAIGPRGSVYD